MRFSELNYSPTRLHLSRSLSLLLMIGAVFVLIAVPALVANWNSSMLMIAIGMGILAVPYLIALFSWTRQWLRLARKRDVLNELMAAVTNVVDAHGGSEALLVNAYGSRLDISRSSDDPNTYHLEVMPFFPEKQGARSFSLQRTALNDLGRSRVKSERAISIRLIAAMVAMMRGNVADLRDGHTLRSDDAESSDIHALVGVADFD